MPRMIDFYANGIIFLVLFIISLVDKELIRTFAIPKKGKTNILNQAKQ
jgi:hypothetical protein